jgi:hypothetical protein
MSGLLPSTEPLCQLLRVFYREASALDPVKHANQAVTRILFLTKAQSEKASTALHTLALLRVITRANAIPVFSSAEFRLTISRLPRPRTGLLTGASIFAHTNSLLDRDTQDDHQTNNKEFMECSFSIDNQPKYKGILLRLRLETLLPSYYKLSEKIIKLVKFLFIIVTSDTYYLEELIESLLCWFRYLRKIS